ncbi:MAG: hypothetical protein AABY64_08330 [Bdellovibrionota bacterium]
MKLIAFLFAVLLSTAVTQAQDMESLLEGRQETQVKRNQDYLSNTIRSFLEKTTPEQNAFLRSIEGGLWNEALIQFTPAFKGTTFETTENFQALHALLYFRVGLTVTGIEELLAIKDAKKIHFQLVTEWKESAKEDHPAWNTARLKWGPTWTEIFGRVIEVRVLSSEVFVKNALSELNELAMKAPVNSKERALIDWHLVIAYAINDQADKAAKIMASLLKATHNPVPVELLNLTAARLLYQNGYFEAAIRYNDKIPKSSAYYLMAQEEKAWAFLRKGEPQNAAAVTQTLVNPTFHGQVGPESFLIRSLAQLKVCDYSAVLETLKFFPKEFKEKSIYLEKLSEKAVTATPAEFSIKNRLMPKAVLVDEKFRQLLQAETLFQQEVKVSDELYTKSLQLTGLQAAFDRLKNQAGQRYQQAKSNSYARVQELARVELAEIKKTLNKLHIVEAEVIQQVQKTDRFKAQLKDDLKAKVGTTGSVAKDTLKFPMEKEFWFDELANYRVDFKKGCQARRTE